MASRQVETMSGHEYKVDEQWLEPWSKNYLIIYITERDDYFYIEKRHTERLVLVKTEYPAGITRLDNGPPDSRYVTERLFVSAHRIWSAYSGSPKKPIDRYIVFWRDLDTGALDKEHIPLGQFMRKIESMVEDGWTRMEVP